MEEASFICLNKLFEIIASERNHQTLISARNLLAVIREPQPYVLPIIPRRLSKVVVLEEHFVLKDLPLYEEACKADAKARHERLEQREEKRQGGKLMRAPSKKGRASSSVACPPAKKKKNRPSIKVTKASTLVSKSPTTSTPSTSNSADSSIQTFKGDFDSLRLDPNDPGTYHFKPELEPIALRFIDEPEAEKDMSADLRADFKKRHRKRLHDAIDMVPPPAKKACPEGAQEEPGRDVPLMPVPPPDTVGPSSAPAAEKEVGSTLGGASSGAIPVEEVLDQKDTPASALPPSWDEMMDMLKRVSCFIDAEPPSTKMSDFFPLTK